jgi:hypothetical protein
MRREEDDDPAKAPDEARSEEMTRSLTTGFGQLDLAPPPGLLMRMPSTGSDDFAHTYRHARPMTFDRQPSGASTDGGHTDSGAFSSGENTSMLPREVDTWTSEDVSEWLNAVGLEPLAEAFAEHGIDGYLLLRLTEHDLDRDLRIPSNLQRVKVYRAIENLRRTTTGRGTHSHASPITFDATTTITSGRETGAHLRSDGARSSASHSHASASDKKSPTKASSDGTSARPSFVSVSVASDGTGGGGVEADVSWLQYVDKAARPGALAEWLLQKTKAIDASTRDGPAGVSEAEALVANPGTALNAYTQAALGALAVMHANGPNDWCASDRSDASRPSPPTSHAAGSSGSAGSRGSRGSGSEFSVRLREALESTPGWNSEVAAFSSQPDVPWLQMRLADLVDDLTSASHKLTETRGNASAGDSSDFRDFQAMPPAAVSAGLASGAFTRPAAAPPTPRTPAGLHFRGPSADSKDDAFKEGSRTSPPPHPEADSALRVDEANRDAASMFSAQDEVAEMQAALMHRQRSAMEEMTAAAAGREAAAYQEFETASSHRARADANALVNKAMADQRELAVQEMQQSVMQKQQALAAKVMMQQREDDAESESMHDKHELMSSEMRARVAHERGASDAHERAMDTLLAHTESMQAALATGDAGALSEAQTDIAQSAAAQRATRAEMLASREALFEAEHEQNEEFAAMMHHKLTLDARKAQRARATAEAQTGIQEAQEEVMRRARAMQSASLEVLPENAPAEPADAEEGDFSSEPILTREHGALESPGASMSEEWEIAFDDIDFAPAGVPCAQNRIGHGGFGEVFLGQLGGMNVAVKRLFNQEHAEVGMREFRAEVSILSRLRHPSIVLWLGASTTAPNCTIVLEYMDRGSLSQLLHRSDTPYTLATAVKWCISVARGMLYLHQHKPFPIIHCDLNSNNVLLNREWVVKITDFGLSKVKRTSRLSRRSGIIGTVNYAAPEVIRGAPSSESSDVYAFGVLAWEILTRKIPWKDLTEYQIIYKMTAATRRKEGDNAATENFETDTTFPPVAQKMVRACWQSRPTDRPFFPTLVDECREMLRVENAKAKRIRDDAKR